MTGSRTPLEVKRDLLENQGPAILESSRRVLVRTTRCSGYHSRVEVNVQEVGGRGGESRNVVSENVAELLVPCRTD